MRIPFRFAMDINIRHKSNVIYMYRSTCNIEAQLHKHTYISLLEFKFLFLQISSFSYFLFFVLLIQFTGSAKSPLAAPSLANKWASIARCFRYFLKLCVLNLSYHKTVQYRINPPLLIYYFITAPNRLEMRSLVLTWALQIHVFH